MFFVFKYIICIKKLTLNVFVRSIRFAIICWFSFHLFCF